MARQNFGFGGGANMQQLMRAPGISRLMPPATEPPLKVENISAKESIAPRLTEDSEMFRNARRSRQSIPVVVNRLQS